MRVILNGVSALKPKTGVGHTTANLYRAVLELGTADEFWLYPGSAVGSLAARYLSHARPPRPIHNPTPTGGRAYKARLTDVAKAAYRAHLRASARWGAFDLYHEPNFVPVPTHLPTVVTVHDLSVLLNPEWHPADRVAFHERHFLRGVAHAAHVIVVSESVRQEMITTFGTPPDRVTAILNGIAPQYFPRPAETIDAVRRKLGLPSRYLLAVGTIEPRKNIRTLLRAFCDLPASSRAACPLVLAGGWGWRSESDRELFETQARPRGAVHLGYVADADLPDLYSGAEALFYPSFYEGFGLPPVEMLACGGGVVASTAAAVREVAGGHAWLLDPHDLAGWRDAMRRVIDDRRALDGCRHGGVAHARRFTWERAARQTHGLYRNVMGLPAAPPAVSSRRAAAAA